MMPPAPDIGHEGRAIRIALAIFVILLVVQVTTEHLMGRVWICACGTVKLWEGEIYSAGNSQHVLDWYTPTHIAHGFLFYALGWLVMRNRPIHWRLALATLLETGWEIMENTPMIINRYRAETISLDYFGDSILNSASDTLVMGLGFILAARLPVWLSVTIVLAMEITLAWLIRDNLTLNILMLVWPLDAVRDWQSVLAPH